MSSTGVRSWHTVALSSQVPVGRPVKSVHGDNELVLFRDRDGSCRALVDRCAHRRAVLSGGKITDQFVLECPYHGWRYNGATGACVEIPNLRNDERIPPNYRVQAFSTVERDGFIQVLLGAPDGAATPDDLSTPALDRQWEGECFIAYPGDMFMETLVDSPSAILDIHKIQILDSHPLGDPDIAGDRVTIEYAALEQRRRPPKRVAEDFAYTLRISATKSQARIFLIANDTAQLQATALLVRVPEGRRITHALWRGAELLDVTGSRTIACRRQVDPVSLRASNNVVSRVWAAAPSPAYVDT